MDKHRRLLDRYPEAVAWDETVTVIGPRFHLEGDVEAEGTVVVAGRVDGGIRSGRFVRVLHGAVVRGPIRGRDILVEGAVDGDVTAEGHLELGKTGRVRGDLSGERIAMAEGAYLRGRVIARSGRIRRFRDRRDD